MTLKCPQAPSRRARLVWNDFVSKVVLGEVDLTSARDLKTMESLGHMLERGSGGIVDCKGHLETKWVSVNCPSKD